MNLLWN